MIDFPDWISIIDFDESQQLGGANNYENEQLMKPFDMDEDQFFFAEDNEELTETDAEINAVSYPANVLDLSYWKF
jgi:hypothetical protein